MSDAQKQKLTITRCTVSGGQAKPMSGDDNVFEAMINPSEYRHGHSISYSGAGDGKGARDRSAALGRTGVETRFAGTNAEKVSFSIVLDGTGVVESSGADGSPPDVNALVQHLKKVTYVYDGERHEPPVVRLAWGGLDLSGANDSAKYFYGRLESMEVTYTLFKPSGEPLRAKVALGFASFMTLEEAEKRANRSSPDLSHLIRVRAGDTLPLLCHEVYGDSRRHLFVARENGLTNFRELEPGTLLRFPPLP